MTDYTELALKAKALIEAIGTLSRARREREFNQVCTPQAVLALIAENERLERKNANQSESIRDYQDLVMGGDVSLGMLKADIRVTTGERDELRAEVAGLKTGYEVYERVNAELRAECEVLRESNDKLNRRNGMLEQNVEVMTETHVLYTWLRKKCDQPSNDVVAVHMNIGHDWATVHDLDTDLRAMIEREEP
jgi:chromosome segregation ATPase